MTNLKKAKARLLAERDEILSIVDSSGGTRKPVELDQTKVGRLSRMDALQDQAMALEVENRRQIELTRIAAALKRIEDGDYGLCAMCGEDIEAKRLELDPSAPLCQICMQGTKN